MSSYSKIKEARYHDVEAGRGGGALVAPVALFRRRKAYLVMLIIPLVYLGLIYSGTVESPFSFALSRDHNPWGEDAAAPSSTGAKPAMLDSLTEPLAQVNGLVGKLPAAAAPAQPHPGSPSSSSSSGAVQNALLDSLHLKGTDALSAFRDSLAAGADPEAAKAAAASPQLAEQIAAQDKRFTIKDEATLLLLQALKTPTYLVPTDWKAVYLDREPIGGVFGLLGGGATNKFTQLLSEVGLDVDPSSASHAARPNALSVYRESRADWVKAVRASTGLVVFSKSYCPHSLRAKELLRELGADFTAYEVDLRSDARTLQPLLAELTGHATFPTVLARDTLLGGNDDLQALHRVDALRSILRAIGAL
ncbi:uncharacterized protein PFL1_05311 [Pseudozyma flocculosa PF-1]|uniref:Related to Glutaredoxin n=2 Tax=Pseudozyma flocculosa TaxID=84751 RepID=A0A5C3FC51_9BASI|nr:uncharacterized protein PFL1_05311 [Pseudozyma flocculosa PF-1]EPQ27027.1 hypothetical protein PFL1_05311 [Pseudozyma flocculosa PF-1]SPO42023.1 related to Glutaredoxin [Pseudozyma flocculosa]